jgi:hypothetical protein
VRPGHLAVLLALAAGGVGGCGLEGSPTMEPGRDCLECHDGGEGKRWSFAGTVYRTADASPGAGVLGAHVQIRDANGWRFQVRTNVAGNFYSAEKVAFPLQVCVEYRGATSCMTEPVARGGCNGCHAVPPSGDAAGRITIP